NDAILSSNCCSYLCMYFFCATGMIKREKEKHPVFFFQRTCECYYSSDKYKRKDENIFDKPFYEKQLIHYLRNRFLISFAMPLIISKNKLAATRKLNQLIFAPLKNLIFIEACLKKTFFFFR